MLCVVGTEYFEFGCYIQCWCFEISSWPLRISFKGCWFAFSISWYRFIGSFRLWFLCKSLIYFIWRQLVVVWSFDTFSSVCFPFGLRRTLEYFRFEMASCWNRILLYQWDWFWYFKFETYLLLVELFTPYICLIYGFVVIWFIQFWRPFGQLRLSNFDFLNLFLLSFLLCFLCIIIPVCVPFIFSS